MSDRSIGPEEVRHMAALSRLTVPDEEVEVFAAQFADILDYMDMLTGIDVTNVEPLYSPVSHSSYLRQDEAKRKREHKDILANAPHADADYFIVPRIV